MRSSIPPLDQNQRIRALSEKQIRPNTSSRVLVLAGTWVAFGSGTITPAYYKTPNGDVVLEGTASAGSAASTITTLPEGYRPKGTILFAVPANGAFGIVQVTSTGVVSHVTGSTTKVSLDGVRFKAYQ